jgi:energy-coupling factor transporter ATP-binding protein EcfA2
MGSDDGAPGLTGTGRRHGDGAGRQARTGTAAIEASHLTKDFGGRTAVADVSFSVARGEVFGFLGPNGAGKTTTVRTLGTLLAPASGSGTVAGIPLAPENGSRSAAGARSCPSRRACTCAPRRAGRRPGPGRRPRRPRADRRAPPQRRDDLPHHAPPREAGRLRDRVAILNTSQDKETSRR